jgi:hypothetical protein
MSEIGKRIIDLQTILDRFEAQEGEVQHIIGKTGMGKTYEATRRALLFLYSGYTVYTTWRLNLPDYYDEREHIWPVIRNLLLFRKEFVRFDFRKNWIYVDLESYDDPETGIFDTEKFAEFLATRTDCIFMLDEGQDVFSSHKRAGEVARQSITRTRHMHKTLIVISQRAQAVDVNARGNVTYFYRCEKKRILFFFTYFKVYRTEEIDDANSYPLWVRHNSQGDVIWKAPVYHSGFAKKRIYDAYDSWFMRQNMVRSQNIELDAFEVSGLDKVRLLWRAIFSREQKPVPDKVAVSETLPEVQASDPEVIHLSTELSTVLPSSLPPPVVVAPIDDKIKGYGIHEKRAWKARAKPRTKVFGTLDLRKPTQLQTAEAHGRG